MNDLIQFDTIPFTVANLINLFLQPHSPDNRALARDCKDVKIDRVYIGSCTGGKTEDFLAAARVFHASVRTPISLLLCCKSIEVLFYSKCL